MPPPVVYNTLATACPAIQVPSVLPNPLAPAGVPKTLPSFVTGSNPASLMPNLQELALALEAVAERGGGIYGILSGFAFTDGGGTTLRVGDGAAGIGGYVGKFTPPNGYVPETLIDGANRPNYVWVGQQGQINITATAAPPAGAWAYAGNAVMNSGSILQFDLSGVLMLPLGGFPERRTADVGAPTDTPPAGARFLNRTPGGVWFWDGAAYRPYGRQMPITQELIPAGAQVTVPAGYQLQMFRRVQVRGRLQVRGHFRVR